MFKYSGIQYASLTVNTKLNSLVYRMLFYVNIYGSYKLLKTVWVFGPPCIYRHVGIKNCWTNSSHLNMQLDAITNQTQLEIHF